MSTLGNCGLNLAHFSRLPRERSRYTAILSSRYRRTTFALVEVEKSFSDQHGAAADRHEASVTGPIQFVRALRTLAQPSRSDSCANPDVPSRATGNDERCENAGVRDSSSPCCGAVGSVRRRKRKWQREPEHDGQACNSAGFCDAWGNHNYRPEHLA